ncbi:MAG TPA: MarR family transcriptional regulator [Solirubrobacterales bacterium]|nr:MarR family transcriptional regulator [Solirubrobacterales bacterium]
MAERGKLPFDPIEEARRQWLEHWPGEAAPSMVAVTSIMRVQQILMARLNELLEPFGLTFPRYEVLMLLHFSGKGSLPVGKIGERLQVHRTSITNSLDGLEKIGLVRRVPHESDGRAVLAEITDSGRETAEHATEALNAAEFGTEPLAPADLDALFTTLRTLRAGAGDFTA